MAKECLFILMAMFMRVIGKWVSVMAMEHFLDLTTVSMRGNGRATRRMGQARRFLGMGLHLKGSI